MTKRVAFFDGSSRGNPGPGGSGSAIVELHSPGPGHTVLWAAATALSHNKPTNNVAEFIGLLRVLQQADEQRWRGLHVVGDSAMIPGLMRRRKAPKSRKLVRLYAESRRLADKVHVSSWQHHYRRHNKAADGLANYAMDTRKSVVYTAGGRVNHQLLQEIQTKIIGDVGRRLEDRDSHGGE
ncbi:hypothetical protein PC116_g14537 [Phytophthora cactorum]|uniref:RNase H type-1 domain-containing protein n=1 Tax=Phytophthora cactorum TaxID=29920 RepID=A0A329S8U8_9STRA|nr:hypothetical protein Pcac1_g11189 [Phytophthora cactorum]KAG2904909.1 hypothetical protein PC114_g11716 [Phytophthora cactorum]KAG2938170.1 hypothetical protein PC117_g11335 [Phytophthora cactorum]KAG3018166.1 hypothetical protein PC119_g10780 [Phytophthora cactorum]KAG3018808.1 hypothetical protein PC120_g10202 [Phytophthora cactorum]